MSLFSKEVTGLQKEKEKILAYYGIISAIYVLLEMFYVKIIACKIKQLKIKNSGKSI